MGKRGRATLGRIITLFFAPLIYIGPASAGCDPSVVQIRGEFGEARFRVEVADDTAERAEGLMHRTELPAGAGMLFVYEHPQSVAFWMRNTLIPLDMIFVDIRGEIVHLHENAQPLDETPIPGGDSVFAVLEINGGLSRRIGFKVGDTLRHPAFPAEGSLWSCD